MHTMSGGNIIELQVESAEVLETEVLETEVLGVRAHAGPKIV